MQVHLVDGTYELFRAFYGAPETKSPEGLEIGATLALARSLLAMVRNELNDARVMAGTTRALVNNLVTGVSTGFEKRLTIIGVGYRAQVQGKNLNLALGYSHPVNHPIPDGITVEMPTQTEIVVKGADKQLVGQTAAEIRRYRPPEPYKGKGVRYSDERVVRKQAKKK